VKSEKIMGKKAVLLIALPVAWLLNACTGSSGKDSADSAPPENVSTVAVQRRNAVSVESFPGTVTALKEVGIRGGVSGYVTGIYFREGKQVKKGQSLYEIDRRQYEASYEEASNDLRIAQQNLDKAQRDVDRYSVLNNQEAIARQRYEYALTDLANAKLEVGKASNELEKAKTNLDYSLIRAPFDGTIGISQVKMGDLITPGQTLLNTISSDDPIGVDFDVDQTELSLYTKLAAMNPGPEDSTFTLVLPDKTIYPMHGRILLIDRAVNAQTGTIRLRLEFPNRDRELRPGMNCNVQVLHKISGEILIPYQSVIEQMGEFFVYLASGSKAVETRVELGERIRNEVVIKNGLNQGAQIVVEGLGKIRDGAPIHATPASNAEQVPEKKK
jgi:RND family efflux transporter MFP subunit